jgi:hypothetical protein
MAVAPTSTFEASESRTAPYMILASGPTETRPTKTTVGATNAEESITGSAPRFLTSIPCLLKSEHCRLRTQSSGVPAERPGVRQACLPKIVEACAPGGVRAVQSPLPSSRPTQAGTTPELMFRAAIGADGEVDLRVAL